MPKNMLSSIGLTFCLLASQTNICAAQDLPNNLINEAAAGLITLQRAQDMAGVKIGLEECWSNAYRKKSFDAAVYCSAFNFAASKFDETSVAVMGYPPSLSTAEATAKSRKAFVLAGVSKEKLGVYVLTVQQRAITAYTRAMNSR